MKTFTKILFAGLMLISFVSKAQTANIIGNTINCHGVPLTLTVAIADLASPYAYLWTNGATTASVTINNNSILRVTVTGTNSQGNLQIVNSPFRIFLFISANAGISANSPTTFCTPGSVDLTATGGGFFSSYLWSTGETTKDITIMLDGSGAGAVLDTQSVWVDVNVLNVCSFASPVIVARSIRETDVVSACPNFNMALSTDSIHAGLVLSYNGVDPDYEFEFVETTTQAVTTAIAIQTRWLKLADVTPALEIGKFYNVNVRPIVDGVPYCYGNICQIGIASVSARVVNIFQNPSNTNFTVNVFAQDQSPVNVKIFDLSGKQISSSQFESPHFEFGGALKAGIYFAYFTHGNANQTMKIIKTN